MRIPDGILKWMRVALRLVFVFVVGSLINGCPHHDPYVELGNGYHLSAICWSCPLRISYFSGYDPRQHSEWLAFNFNGEYSLLNEKSYERLTFDTEAEWRVAARQKNAVPPSGFVGEMNNITKFKSNDRYVIGQHDSGWFLLDMQEDALLTWPTASEWEIAARNTAHMDTSNLLNPKSMWVQTREAWEYPVLIGFLMCGVPWGFFPLFRRRQKTRSYRLFWPPLTPPSQKADQTNCN